MDTIDEEVERRNAKIVELRKKAYEESGGIKNALYSILPPMTTREDVMREYEVEFEDYHIAVELPSGWVMCDNLGELAVTIARNLGREDIVNLLNGSPVRGFNVELNKEYRSKVEEYLLKFGDDTTSRICSK